MNKLIMMIGAAAVAVGAILPSAALADAVRVYDVDDYAQFGTSDLLMQLDGIRNVGVTAAHEISPATWVDLAGGHAVATNGTPVFSGDAWVADKASYFSTSSTAVKDALAAKSFTLEMMISNPGEQERNSFEYWMFLGDDMSHRQLVVSLRQQNTDKNPLVQCVQYCESGWKDRSQFSANSITSWNTRQYVAVVCDSTGATTYCDGTNRIHQTSGGTVMASQSGITIGARFDGESPLYAGSEICAIRMTARALTADELLRNSQVDIARFRNGAAAGVAGTVNVIVASNFAEAEGAEPCGKYVAQSGDAFTAPGTVVAKNVGYVLGGYALETWDDANSAWGAAVTNSGSAAYTYSGSGKVRLTWLWTPILRSATGYDVGDYVQSGLVGHFDAIRNAGVGTPHRSDAMTWKNLAAGYPDATLDFRPGRTSNAPSWTDTSYSFNDDAMFSTDATLDLGTNFTVQIAITADPSAQSGKATVNGHEDASKYNAWFNDNPKNDYGFWTDGTSTSLVGNFNKFKSDSGSIRPTISSWGGRYVTWMLDGDNKTAYTFESATSSNSKTYTPNATVHAARKYSWGSEISSSGNMQAFLKGEYHNVRIYNRTLTDAELKQNRRIDDIRYREVADVTVVNGAVGTTGTMGKSSVDDGAYNIETGFWTFTAAPRSVAGVTYSPRLTVETLTGDGWTRIGRHWTDAYTVAAPVASRLRLTWTWEQRKGLTISFH